MHDTLVNDVKGNIDKYEIIEDKIYLKGWSFHSVYGICSIRLRYLTNQNEEIITNPNYNNINVRPDIIDFYKLDSNKNLCCGWEFTLLDKNIKDIKMEMLIDETWQPIFEFNNSIFRKDQFIKNYSCKKEIKYIPSFLG